MQTYGLSGGWKAFFWIFGILATPIFLLGVPVIILALKARVEIDDEAFSFWWLGKKTIPWADMVDVSKAPPANALGAGMQPIFITRADGKKFTFPSGTFENRDAIRQRLAQHIANS
jgi:hypothetical protein